MDFMGLGCGMVLYTCRIYGLMKMDEHFNNITVVDRHLPDLCVNKLSRQILDLSELYYKIFSILIESLMYGTLEINLVGIKTTSIFVYNPSYRSRCVSL